MINLEWSKGALWDTGVLQRGTKNIKLFNYPIGTTDKEGARKWFFDTNIYCANSLTAPRELKILDFALCIIGDITTIQGNNLIVDAPHYIITDNAKMTFISDNFKLERFLSDMHIVTWPPVKFPLDIPIQKDISKIVYHLKWGSRFRVNIDWPEPVKICNDIRLSIAMLGLIGIHH